MDENDLRNAMSAAVTQHPEPPPMESRPVLITARRAARRRNVLACSGAAVVVLGVTLAALPGQGYLDGGTGHAPAAAPSAPAEPFPTAFPSEEAPSDDNTQPSWPAEASGDSTADSGVHYQNGVALLEKVMEVVPPGYTVPTGARPGGIPWRLHQATIDGDDWAYLASVPLVKDGGTGQITVEVYEPGNDLPAEACELAQSYWENGGSCEKRDLGEGEVGIVTEPQGRGGVDQGATYRHPDGTVVRVVQGLSTDDTGDKPLESLPFTVDELVELAGSGRFK
ncbi:hypothetical protein [Actinoplanes sp. NPDC049802]|uniref:hypothetical protein n=1 Tax=Actinoplanes sp. NPDC049802 TaxID=3154742 RepID=UPI003403A8B1